MCDSWFPARFKRYWQILKKYKLLKSIQFLSRNRCSVLDCPENMTEKTFSLRPRYICFYYILQFQNKELTNYNWQYKLSMLKVYKLIKDKYQVQLKAIISVYYYFKNMQVWPCFYVWHHVSFVFKLQIYSPVPNSGRVRNKRRVYQVSKHNNRRVLN